MTLLLAIGPAVVLLPLVLAGGVVAAWLGLRKKPSKRAKGPARPGKDPVVPAPLPIVYMPAAVTKGGVPLLRIESAFGAYKWATTTAVQNGATAASNGGDVLRSLAASIPGVGPEGVPTNTGVIMAELEAPNDDEWSDLLGRASTVTWGEVVTAAEKWLQEKGLA